MDALHFFSDNPTPPKWNIIDKRWSNEPTLSSAHGVESASTQHINHVDVSSTPIIHQHVDPVSTSSSAAVPLERANQTIFSIASDLFGPSWPDEPTPNTPQSPIAVAPQSHTVAQQSLRIMQISISDSLAPAKPKELTPEAASP